MASIRLEHLRKEFGPVIAVEDLSLEIKDGEFAALLGPSGCGKTTTMNMIAGLEVPSSGAIYFDERSMGEVLPGNRGVGFVFQNYAIFTHMSVAQNMGFGLKIAGKPKEEIAGEVRKVGELLQLTHMLDWNAGRLSINDMQKVALGRSMIMNPGIFLLDEPFSNLDAAFRAYMRAELKSIQRRLKQTMIYVTHDQVEAMSMADKIAVMYCGQLYQFGTPEEVYNKPQNTFVARFIGSPNMNFLTADFQVEEAKGVLVQRNGGARLPVNGQRQKLLEAKKSETGLIVGIRPEHMHLFGEATPDTLWQGTVYAIEPLGPKTIVHVQVGQDMMQVSAPPAHRPRVGAPQWIALDLQYLHIFDGDTKQVIR